MGHRLALCLPLLMLATPSELAAQVRDPWRDDAMASTQSPLSATIASIALSMKSRPIQDSRCYLMNGGAVESFFISEDTSVGSVIGTLSVNGDPRDDLGDVSLRVQEKGAAVGLAPGSKNLTLLRELDREEKQGPSNVYVNVRCDRRRTTDPSFIIPVSVRVWDVNDNAPQWVGAPYRVRVSELTAIGTRILAPRATDADQPGPHATLHYSVVPGPHSELVHFAHELESVVVVGSTLDYESLRNFTVTLRAADAGSPPLHADAQLIVELLDADDQNPAFSYEHYTAVLPDDTQKNSILVTSPGPILAADQDSGINAPLFYTTSGDNKHLVTINRDSGQVIVTDQLLAIAQPVTIVIKATQVDNADRYALATLSVSRRTQNAPASRGVRFSRTQYHCRVSEAAAPGMLLVTLQTDPPPSSHTHSPLQFFVSDRSFLDKFAINSAGEVLLRRSLDYEASDSYYYQVMVTNGIANDTASLNITVANVNEWEPRFRYPQYEFRVDAPPSEGDEMDDMEKMNRMGLLPVGKLDVFDGDKADTVTLSLRGPDASMLYINASGEMFLRQEALATLNTSVLHVVATAADSGEPPRQTSVPVLVHVSSKLLRAETSTSTTPLLAAGGAAIALLVMLLCAALLVLRRSRRSKPSPAPTTKPYTAHEKPRSPPTIAPPPASPPALPPASPLAVGTSGSLQSVSAGASTILANSSSSLDLRDSLPTNGVINGGGLRGSRGKVAPLPPLVGVGVPATGSGLSLMSDHLASGPGGGAGRSGVAWPSSTIPARVKKLSWDDAAPNDNKDSGVVEASNAARHDHMNLTVYF